MKLNDSDRKGTFRIFRIFWGFCALVCLYGCQSGDEDLSIIPPNPDDFVVRYTDTLTVNMATVPTDSIYTDGTARLLAGSYQDPYLGLVQSIPYFQTQLTGSLANETKAVYDSLVLSLAYDYYYGDTTQFQTFSVYPITDDITKKTYYNVNSTPYLSTALGVARFKPAPRGKKPLYIRLSDEFGQSIFEAGKASKLKNNEEWLAILKGLAIVADRSANTTLLGFKSSNDSSAIKLYYHTNGADGKTESVNSFTINKGYNHTVTERGSTALKSLGSSSKVGLSSLSSGNITAIQNGTGLKTRLDIPFLKKLKTVGNIIINRAFLRIEPIKGSSTKPLTPPATLSLYACNKNNQSLGQIADLNGNPVTASFTEDIINNKSYYQFDISEYVISKISEDNDLMETGLLLVPSSGAATEFSRVVLGDQKNSAATTKIEVYYTYIKQ